MSKHRKGQSRKKKQKQRAAQAKGVQSRRHTAAANRLAASFQVLTLSDDVRIALAGRLDCAVPPMVLPLGHPGLRINPLAVFRAPDAVVISSDGESASDDDCYEVLPPITATTVVLNLVNDLGNDDIQFVSTTSGLLAQDLPHPRRFCMAHPFTLCWAKKTVAGNEKACARCYCFVCDVEWAECTQWTSENTKRPAHCNSHGGRNSAMWTLMKSQWHQSAARAAAAAVAPIHVELQC